MKKRDFIKTSVYAACIAVLPACGGRSAEGDGREIGNTIDDANNSLNITHLENGEIAWRKANHNVRVRMSSDLTMINFDCLSDSSWIPVAAYPPGRTWTIYSDWSDRWFRKPLPITPKTYSIDGNGDLVLMGEVEIEANRWLVSDSYSIEYGMLRVDRLFRHIGMETQDKITLESRIRMPLGVNERVFIPAVYYNNNPNGDNLIKIKGEQIQIGLYEEHRLPIPMINMESELDSIRLYGSLLTIPSTLNQGNKGKDHWWSLGVEYGEKCIDLISVTGPVATTGRYSKVYGRNATSNFEDKYIDYDDAYLVIKGPQDINKAFYLDFGSKVKLSYAFRETLWKAYSAFKPTKNKFSVPFLEAMQLVEDHAGTRFDSKDKYYAQIKFGANIGNSEYIKISLDNAGSDTYRFIQAGDVLPQGTSRDRVIGVPITSASGGVWAIESIEALKIAIRDNAHSVVWAKEISSVNGGYTLSLSSRRQTLDESDNILLLENPSEITLESSNNIKFTKLNNSSLNGSANEIAKMQRSTNLNTEPAGYLLFPGDRSSYQYGWIGGSMAIAYGRLRKGVRESNQQIIDEAQRAIQFFVDNAALNSAGLHASGYDINTDSWGIDTYSRSYGENMFHFAAVVDCALEAHLPKADSWKNTLIACADFIADLNLPAEMFPTGFSGDGGVYGWPQEPYPAVGVFCLLPLARAAKLVETSDPVRYSKYRNRVVTVMEAYWNNSFKDMTNPPMGATLDANGIDKEAFSVLLSASLETYSLTKTSNHLQMCKDIADYCLTWMYFHNVPLVLDKDHLTDEILAKNTSTVGMTFISQQNQEVDVYGYNMAPDFLLLAQYTQDERYRQIADVLFGAATQTLNRKSMRFDSDSPLGVQSEHYNQTNCTYYSDIRSWRGWRQAPGIGWTLGAALMGGNRLADLDAKNYKFQVP